jgi:DNA-nicking Smr family endonuclease
MARHRPHDPQDAAPDEDALAFRAAVRDVKPLPQSPPAVGLHPVRERSRAARIRRAAAADPDLAHQMPLIDAAAGDAALTGDAPLSFQRSGVRIQVMRRLRRGLYPVEDELDLHGLGQAAARDQLSDFIAISRAAGRRCVRIIHGKGYRSGARGPVLKVAVNLWLQRHSDVMAFTSAKAIDGGTGAVYVLLRV